MIYELRGFDHYDYEYYHIGFYATYQEAMEAFRRERDNQRIYSNDDTLEVRALQEDDDYLQQFESSGSLE